MSKSKRRIVFLNRSYWPDIEATGQLLTDLCAGLASDFDVHVICGQPNCPESGASYVKSGIQQRDGVTVHRLTHHQFHKRNPFGRILNLVSFYASTRSYLRKKDLSPDIVVSETDPFLLPLAGASYARRTGAAHCVYLQDVYPDIAEAVGKVRVPLLASFLRKRLRNAYKKASRVVVLGRCMRRRLMEPKWGLNREKIEIIPNWADCDSIVPVSHDENSFRKKMNLGDSFVVMHSGNMGLTQRLEVLLSAAEHPNWPERAKLLIVGNGASRDMLLEHAKTLNVPAGRVEFADYQPRNALAESLSAADLHVVSMHENITGCLCPSKLYGVMASGRSILAIADRRTDLCQTVIERDLGWCADPGDVQGIADAVAKAYGELADDQFDASHVLDSGLASQRTRATRSMALEHFDRPVIINRFKKLFCDLLTEQGILEHFPLTSDASVHTLAITESGSEDTSDSGVALTL